MLKPDVIMWLKNHCNRYNNPHYCLNNACIIRGGWTSKQPSVDRIDQANEIATCKPHEILQELERLNTELEPKPKHSPGCCCGRC
jgi:hypothetical protein